MTKELLTGSALALLLAVTPAAAQTDNATTQEPQAQTDSTDSTTVTVPAEGTAEAEGEAIETQDTAQDVETPDAGEMDAAESETLTTDEPATAETDTLETEQDAVTATETMEGDDAAMDTAETEATTDAAPMEQASGEMYIGQQSEEELLASDLMSVNVQNAEGENLGSIKDVLITEDRGVQAVVIGIGGFLGIGEKDVAINYDQVERSRDENGELVLTLNATREELENAPQFVSLEEREEAERQQAEAAQNESTMGTDTMGSGSSTTGTTGTAQ
ncbi:PRC-barrel domain-containing protein [Lutibaculum baratangense]|uniref:PRC-barrel domain protein n=1 Tax=Lutibaculum baratangense AMV1 TaxID=631454 RepID=V4QRQ2_9HYPH|nr:PRC-barrel domain-containing protein [Lutibaculum baratangense]ESR22412.1 PRC-barrel domain protein [Lutibaculum baratangense AMV1]